MPTGEGERLGPPRGRGRLSARLDAPGHHQSRRGEQGSESADVGHVEQVRARSGPSAAWPRGSRRPRRSSRAGRSARPARPAPAAGPPRSARPARTGRRRRPVARGRPAACKNRSAIASQPGREPTRIASRTHWPSSGPADPEAPLGLVVVGDAARPRRLRLAAAGGAEVDRRTARARPPGGPSTIGSSALCLALVAEQEGRRDRPACRRPETSRPRRARPAPRSPDGPLCRPRAIGGGRRAFGAADEVASGPPGDGPRPTPSARDDRAPAAGPAAAAAFLAGRTRGSSRSSSAARGRPG